MTQTGSARLTDAEIEAMTEAGTMKRPMTAERIALMREYAIPLNIVCTLNGAVTEGLLGGVFIEDLNDLCDEYLRLRRAAEYVIPFLQAVVDDWETVSEHAAPDDFIQEFLDAHRQESPRD